MSSNWFYIQQWKKKRLSNIGVEMNNYDADSLYRSMIGYYDNKEYFALINKEDKWKVVSSKDEVKDWKIIKQQIK